MPKRFCSVLAALLVILALSAPAYADETEIVGLGTFTAGGAVDIYLNRTNGGSAEVVSGALSQGLEIKAENREDGSYFYLRGTPMTAGSFSFTVRYLDGAGSFLAEARYSLKIEAARPVLNYEREISVTVGSPAAITVNASTGDAGSLSCRWFSGTGGDDMTVIPGQMAFSISPDTSKEGLTYYRCEVTNTNSTSQASTLTDMISVTVSSPELTGISINSMPGKQEYHKGESLNTDGLKISLTFSNGTSKTVSEGFTVSPMILDAVGTQKITVSYKSFTCSYPVLVSEAEEEIKEISIVSMPRKTEYAPGETISLEGLKIRVITNKETRDIITGFFCSPTTFYDEGRQTVTVFYGESKCTFDVTVRRPDTATPSPAPTPTATPIPVFTPQPSATPQSGQQSAADIAAEAVTASPAGADTEIKIPEGAVPVLGGDEEETRSVSRLTVAIVVIAIVALACLGVYAFIMQDPKARKALMKLFSKKK